MGTNYLFIIMTEDITTDLTKFNRAVKTAEDRLELIKRFRAIIQNYSDAKQ